LREAQARFRRVTIPAAVPYSSTTSGLAAAAQALPQQLVDQQRLGDAVDRAGPRAQFRSRA
jgi:hypothetical protein